MWGGSRTPSPQPYVSRSQEMSELGYLHERWDIYYHQYLLHSCYHHESIWMDGMWYFPEYGRRPETLHMFAPTRYNPVGDFKYYDFHLPGGDVIESMAWRYIGEEDPDKEWLQDYVAYNLNMVTLNMIVLTPGELVN